MFLQNPYDQLELLLTEIWREVIQYEDWTKIDQMENFDERTVMKVREGVKQILGCLKTNKRETFDDVISKLLIKYAMVEGEIPHFILKDIDERMEDINQGKVHSFKEAKKRVFSKDGKL